ncbi:MAG: 16S rRNA (cytosine(967)-C(5))-methyltransferase, partial [Lachnospiraceae bacterium]|nr:16S rRNA (cytosine(967)-C(5))-methyltransferase [Lachnospiraceae bacterium]
MQANIREIAADALTEAAAGKKKPMNVLGDTLSKYAYLSKQDRSFLNRLFRGTYEQEIRLDHIISRFAKTGAKKMRPFIRALLRISVYQICFMDHVPDSAAVNEAVKIVKRRGFASLAGFVNGVLRNISRQKDSITYPDPAADPAGYISIMYSLPAFIADMWIKRYGFEAAETMARAGIEADRALTLCVFGDEEKQAGVRQAFEAAGVRAEGGAYCKNALKVTDFDTVAALPLFNEGAYQVQDESSMLSVLAAGIKPGDTVIDVCAAPGGKSIYAAHLTGENGCVVARDISEFKTDIIRENAARTGMRNMLIRTQDALVFTPDYEEKADVLIADLPCSGLGVIGKKP